MSTPARFRIHSEGFDIPWEVVAPFADQAHANHYQTLERLHERGGLSPQELWCVMNRKPLRSFNEITEEAALAWARGLRSQS